MPQKRVTLFDVNLKKKLIFEHVRRYVRVISALVELKVRWRLALDLRYFSTLVVRAPVEKLRTR